MNKVFLVVKERRLNGGHGEAGSRILSLAGSDDYFERRTFPAFSDSSSAEKALKEFGCRGHQVIELEVVDVK